MAILVNWRWSLPSVVTACVTISLCLASTTVCTLYAATLPPPWLLLCRIKRVGIGQGDLPKLVLLHRRLQGAIALAALAQLSDARLQLFTAQRRLGRLLLVVAVELFEVAPDLLLDVLKALGQLGLREEPLAAIAG